MTYLNTYGNKDPLPSPVHCRAFCSVFPEISEKLFENRPLPKDFSSPTTYEDYKTLFGNGGRMPSNILQCAVFDLRHQTGFSGGQFLELLSTLAEDSRPPVQIAIMDVLRSSDVVRDKIPGTHLWSLLSYMIDTAGTKKGMSGVVIRELADDVLNRKLGHRLSVISGGAQGGAVPELVAA